MIRQEIALACLAQVLFRNTVAVVHADPRAPMPPLRASERAATTYMTSARAREFAAGRAAARRAMRALGQIERPVPRGTDRAPIWPSGLTGAITHTRTDCLAAVTDDPSLAGLGLDLEPATPLDPELLSEICTPAELGWLDTVVPSRRAYLAKLVFCAKEAVFKAQYPISQQMLDFHDVTVSLDPGGRNFDAQVHPRLRGFGTPVTIPGRVAIGSGNLIAAVEISGQHHHG